MPARAPILALLVIAATAVALPASASAALCGATDARTGRSVTGTLTLDPDSVATKAFKRSTGTKQLYLNYRVAGCELAPTGPAPAVLIHPAKGDGDDFPVGSLTPKDFVRQPGRVAFDVDVDLGKLRSGTFSGLAEVDVPGLDSALTPVAASHSSGPFWPLVLAILGALGGVVTTVLLGRRSSKMDLTPLQEGALLAAGVVAGVLAGIGTWVNQDVWMLWSSNFLGTLAAGYTFATTGTVLTLAKILSGEEPDDPPARAPATPVPQGG
jgi:hypothetical protein